MLATVAALASGCGLGEGDGADDGDGAGGTDTTLGTTVADPAGQPTSPTDPAGDPAASGAGGAPGAAVPDGGHVAFFALVDVATGVVVADLAPLVDGGLGTDPDPAALVELRLAPDVTVEFLVGGAPAPVDLATFGAVFAESATPDQATIAASPFRITVVAGAVTSVRQLT